MSRTTFTVISAVLIAGLLVLSTLTCLQKRSWQAAVSSLVESGEPATFADILESRPAFDASPRTVASIAGQVAEELETVSGSISRGVLGMHDGPDLDFFQGIPHDAIEPTRRYLAARTPKLSPLAKLTGLEPGRFSIAYQNSPTAFIEQAPPLSLLRHVLYLQAAMAIIDRDTSTPLRNAEYMFKIAETLTDEPAVMGMLERSSHALTATQVLEDLLQVGPLSDAELVRFEQQIAQFLKAKSIRWAVLGERASYIAFTDQTMSLTKNPFLFWVIGDPEEELEPLQAVLDVTDSYSKLLEAAENADRDNEESLLAPALYPAVLREVYTRMKLQTARMASACERYRNVTGRLPGTLDDLVPSYVGTIPTDLFSDDPLRFAKIDGGIVIYSVGQNRVDDDGSVVRLGKEKWPRDCGFRLLQAGNRGLILVPETR